MNAKGITAVFHPQAWIGDYAIDATPEGPTEFDVTATILAMGHGAAMLIRDDTYESDNLRHADTAPEWVREWSGPFYVEVSESIAEFFAND
jgi:hypothetical protein